jgi:hypothetical protein
MSTTNLINSEAQRLRASIEKLSKQLQSDKAQLDRIVSACRHEWGDTVYDPEVTPGYHIPGDPPGVGGVDHQFPMDVPEKITKRWRRTCRNCGHPVWTTHTRSIGEGPAF